MEERLPRKLAAILYADVAGYSRLTGEDEDATHRRLNEGLDLISAAVTAHRGQVMHYAGDAVLAMFDAVVDALSSATEIQEELLARNRELPEGQKVQFRIGVNLGDVIEDRGDIYGDGVNVAARLESLAEPGGICVSDAVRTAAGKKLSLDYEAMGEQEVKNIAEPVRTYRVVMRADERQALITEVRRCARPPLDVRYCTTEDGVHLAYAAVGEGPPLVKAGSFLTHLQYDTEGVLFTNWIEELSRDYCYIRYDERGNGLSDWTVEGFSFEAMVRDLEAVVDALELQDFVLFGVSQGASVAIEYAHRHPERITCLLIFGGYAAGWQHSPDAQYRARRRAMLELTSAAWGDANPAGRQVYASLFLPDGTLEQHREFTHLLQTTTTPENAYKILKTFSEIDVREILGEIAVPTLVMHCSDDAVVPFEAGRELATNIPGARFVPLEGSNHIIRGSDPAWPRFMNEIRRFIAEHV